MIRCEDARDLLLEADAEELLGEGDSDLATHVRECSACAELGQRILDGQAVLSEALAGMATRIAPEADPARARQDAVGLPAGVTVREGDEDGGTRAGGLPSGAAAWRWSRRVVWRVGVPLAAAAAAALALFQLPGSEATRDPFAVPPEWAHLAAAPSGSQAVASSGTDADVAVLPTQNPDITVVWFIR